MSKENGSNHAHSGLEIYNTASMDSATDLEKGLANVPSTPRKSNESDAAADQYKPRYESEYGDGDASVASGDASQKFTGSCRSDRSAKSRPSSKDEDVDTESAYRPPSVVGNTATLQASVHTQPSMLGDGEERDEKAPPATPLDCGWIVKHHSDELVIPITLQEPSRLARVAQSIQNWRQGSTLNGEMADKTTGAGTNRWRRNEDASFRISIAELHRIRMRKLQFKLASHAWYMKQNKTEPPAPWEADLQEYTKALQDYDYMIKCSSAQRDWFLISGERMVDAYVMYRVGVQPSPDRNEGGQSNNSDQNKAKNGKNKRGTIPVLGPWEEEKTPIGGTRNENVKKSWILGFRQRVVMAALGGVFLIAPMWLMVLHNTLYTALVSTTVLVFVFGLVMSALVEGPMDVLSGTAAYAAVLVVFVGLGPSGGAS